MEDKTYLINIEELQERIGHRFERTNLLKEALTHSSVVGAQSNRERLADYNRLEFLGDRVLGLVISEILLTRYSNEEVGQIALRYNALVKRETCADVARDLKLGPCIKLAKSERLSGGQDKSGILADACEALIGAVYLDGGLKAARSLVNMGWTDKLDSQILAKKDSKTKLQEWSHRMMLNPPEYTTTNVADPSNQSMFVVKVMIAGIGSAKGSGITKRAAEQQAAELFLRQTDKSSN